MALEQELPKRVDSGLLEKILMLPWLARTVDELQHGEILKGSYQDNPTYYQDLIHSLNPPVWLSLEYKPESSELKIFSGVKNLSTKEAWDFIVKDCENYLKKSGLNQKFEGISLDIFIQQRRYTRIKFYTKIGKAHHWEATISDSPLNFLQRTTFLDKFQYEDRHGLLR